MVQLNIHVQLASDPEAFQYLYLGTLAFSPLLRTSISWVLLSHMHQGGQGSGSLPVPLLRHFNFFSAFENFYLLGTSLSHASRWPRKVFCNHRKHKGNTIGLVELCILYSNNGQCIINKSLILPAVIWKTRWLLLQLPL